MGTIFSGGSIIPFADLQGRAARASSGLASLGVAQNDLVVVILRNEPAFFEVGFAIGALGAYSTPFNWHSSQDEMAYLLADAGPRAVIIHADLLARFGPLLPADVPVLVVPTPDGLPEDACRVPTDRTDWSIWLEGFAPYSGERMPSPGSIVYTSGTTGRPKGVRRYPPGPGQEKAVVDFMARNFGFGVFGKHTDQIVDLVSAPLYHSAPNSNATIALGLGADVILQPRFDAEGFLQLVERYGVTHAYMPPIMFNRLLALPAEVRSRYDVSSLRAVTHMGAPCPEPVKRAMIEWWGPVVNEGYGSTEARLVTTCSAEEWLERPGTVGKADAATLIRIIDADGRTVPEGIPGEVCSKTPGMADFTYHGDDAKRAGLDRGDGFITTGDIGYLDPDGYLFLCDRAIDMIISGGVNIYPAEIESVLSGMPGVVDCAVFGIPDEEFGELICAVVQPLPDARIDETAVAGFLGARLASFKLPRRIEFTGHLPRNDAGKILKRKLREPFWQAAGRNI